MKNMTIRLRMHPMYTDFITFYFGKDENGRILASERKTIGLLIKNLLKKQPQFPDNREYCRGQFIELTLPNYSDVNTLYRNYISPNSERIIVKKIRNQFYYELHEFIVETFGSGLTEYRSAINLFCEQFEIDEAHYKVNSLEREYRRYRDRDNLVEKTKKITSVLSLCLSFICPLLVCFSTISNHTKLFH